MTRKTWEDVTAELVAEGKAAWPFTMPRVPPPAPCQPTTEAAS